jgi:hypothetical protein
VFWSFSSPGCGASSVGGSLGAAGWFAIDAHWFSSRRFITASQVGCARQGPEVTHDPTRRLVSPSDNLAVVARNRLARAATHLDARAAAMRARRGQGKARIKPGPGLRAVLSR